MVGFWTGGRKSLRVQIDAEEAQSLRPLKELLNAETDEDHRAEIKKQIAEIKAEYKKKRKDADSVLYSTR